MPKQNETKVKKCKACGETKPVDQFKRRLSKRQSASLLRRSSVVIGLLVDSVRCRTCWSELKRQTPLTRKEILNKKQSGDMKGVMADLLLKQKEEDKHKVKSRKMKEYWKNKKTKYLKQLEQNLQQQVAKYANRYHAYKTTIKKETRQKNKEIKQGQMFPNQQPPPQNAMLEQHRWNYEQARQARDELLKKAREGIDVEVDVVIANFIKRKEKDYVGLD